MTDHERLMALIKVLLERKILSAFDLVELECYDLLPEALRK